VLTYFLGPLLALLPQRWRKSLFSNLPVHWRMATILSGFGESVVALVALMYWYSYMMTRWSPQEDEVQEDEVIEAQVLALLWQA
jgi:hypothetical protein